MAMVLNFEVMSDKNNLYYWKLGTETCRLEIIYIIGS